MIIITIIPRIPINKEGVASHASLLLLDKYLSNLPTTIQVPAFQSLCMHWDGLYHLYIYSL